MSAKTMRVPLAVIVIFVLGYGPGICRAASITWTSDELDVDADISDFGIALEASYFNGNNNNNAQPGAVQLVDPVTVNGVTFAATDFGAGDSLSSLTGLTYNAGEFGHTTATSGYPALIAGLGFESGVDPQQADLAGLTVGQEYLVQFLYYHSTVDRSVTIQDGAGGDVTLTDTSNDGIGVIATGTFTADAVVQSLTFDANTGSQFLNAYQLRAIDELPPVGPELTVNRDTGGLVLATEISQNILGYSSTSNAGALDQAGWKPISGNYDVDGDGSVDSDDTWVVLTGAGVDTDLSEAELGGPGPRDGGTLAAGSPLVLSPGGAWLKYYDETDIRMTLLLADGTQPNVPVRYIGNGDAPFDKGDLNFDGAIDALDHAIFAAGLHTDLSALSIVEAYAMGDMNEDLASNAVDFLLFRDIYDGVHGGGAFDSLAAGVPEPSAMMLLLVGSLLLVVRKRRSVYRMAGPWTLSYAVALGLAVSSGASAETLQVQLSPTNADLHPGWTAVLGDSVPLTATISGGEFDGLGITATGTHTRSSNSPGGYLVVDHLDGDRDILLSGGLLTNTSDVDLTLTLAGLADGDYSIRTYHHTYYNRTDGFDFDVLVTDAVVSDSLIHADVPISFGTPITTQGLAFLETSFAVSGGSSATLTFHPEAADFATNGGDHLNLNGFELTAGELEPLVPIVPTLQVNTTTGQIAIANNMDVPFDLEYYEITSTSGSLDPIGWNSLDDQDVGFGTEAGESWTEAGGSSTRLLSEFFTLGSTALAQAETLDLGHGFDAPGTQDIEFRYIAGDALLSGTLEYITDGVLLGDVNLDTVVNGLDVDPFVDVLLGGSFQAEADMNTDGVVNGLDVDPFVAEVIGGGVQAVPEPSTLALLALAGLAMVFRFSREYNQHRNRSRVVMCPPPRNVATKEPALTKPLELATLWGGVGGGETRQIAVPRLPVP